MLQIRTARRNPPLFPVGDAARRAIYEFQRITTNNHNSRKVLAAAEKRSSGFYFFVSLKKVVSSGKYFAHNSESTLKAQIIRVNARLHAYNCNSKLLQSTGGRTDGRTSWCVNCWVFFFLSWGVGIRLQTPPGIAHSFTAFIELFEIDARVPEC